MYKLNVVEKSILKKIISNARATYFRKNKHIFNEITMEDEEIKKKNTKEDYIRFSDFKIKAEDIAEIFEEPKLAKITKALSYVEKKIIYLYFVEDKTDKEIAKIMNLSEDTIYRRRRKVLKKFKNEIIKVK